MDNLELVRVQVDYAVQQVNLLQRVPQAGEVKVIREVIFLLWAEAVVRTMVVLGGQTLESNNNCTIQRRRSRIQRRLGPRPVFSSRRGLRDPAGARNAHRLESRNRLESCAPSHCVRLLGGQQYGKHRCSETSRFGTSAGNKGWIPIRGTLDINSRACSRLECSVEPILSMMTRLWRWASGGFKLPLTVFNLVYPKRRAGWARKGALEFSCNLQKPLDP